MENQSKLWSIASVVVNGAMLREKKTKSKMRKAFIKNILLPKKEN